MAVTIFAAIDVGSHETSMRIYEISKNMVYTKSSMFTIQQDSVLKRTLPNTLAILP